MKKIELNAGYIVKDDEGDYSLVISHHGSLYGLCFPNNGETPVVLNIDRDAMLLADYEITKVYGWVENEDIIFPRRNFVISTLDRPLLWEREEEPKEITWETNYDTLKTKEDKLKWVKSARTELSNIIDNNDLIESIAGGFLLSALNLVENDINKMED